MSEDTNNLWSKVVNEGVEDRVEVNQRMLIDKMLSRYSSDFVLYRELIQNSDDAQSTSFTLDIKCDPLSSKIDYQSINKSTSKTKTSLLQGFNQLLKNPWGLTSNTNEIRTSNENTFEETLNNCLINEIRTTNNGHIFNSDDWKRVITIAEGNTNIDAIGQFGVGFFSVFSYSEKPMIQSGKYCLAFAWQNGKTLTTFRKELPVNEQTQTTSIILPMKTKYLLQTKSHHLNSSKAKQNCQTNEIIPILDFIQLKFYLTKVLSFTKYLQNIFIRINDQLIFHIHKTKELLESNKYSLALKQSNLNSNEHQFLRFQSIQQTKQIFQIQNGPQIELLHLDVQANILLDQQFQKQIQQIIKKDLPTNISIQFLFTPNHLFHDDHEYLFLKNTNLEYEMLKELIPLKLIDQQLNSSGQIFIGLATHQSTGIGMHIFTHLIPTIERENIDLQDPYISIWNEQLLNSIGKIIRFIYDQTILNTINHIDQQSNHVINSILSQFAFQTSTPNKDIGRLILDGFVSLDKDLLVPVKRSPSDKYLSLIPSTEAFLTNSKYLERFVHYPLVPFSLSQNEFFKRLKEYHFIEDINFDFLIKKLNQTIFSFDEFVNLFQWLISNDIQNNKTFIKSILSQISYQDTNQIIQLKHIQFYDQLNIPQSILPSNVLPSIIMNFISKNDLEKCLLLSPITYKHVIFYTIQNSQEHHKFLNEKTSKILLHLISKCFNQLTKDEFNEIKEILSNFQCIPTINGMKSPNESYIQSSNLNSNLSIIQLAQDNDEYVVSIEFLKAIGCRSIFIPNENDFIQSNEEFIKDLLEKRKSLSENDFNALKSTQCILGKQFSSQDNSIKKKFKPSELHFPFVGERLQWNDLLVVDWNDQIELNSREFIFLKQLGVKQVPNLTNLILRINEEYQQQSSKSIENYQIPKAFIFFIENFREFYSKVWKHSIIDIPFLPSIFPPSNDVFLTLPKYVFKETNPFYPCLLPEVNRYFSLNFDIDLIDIKQRPTISMAFQFLIENKSNLLTSENASTYFAYLSKLDGINKAFIQQISNIEFIPLKKNQYAKPCQVFLRSTTNDQTQSTEGLIDYVDFGSEANSFLRTIGVLSYPTADLLANLLIDRQDLFFKDQNQDSIKDKLNVYINCLKQLSIASNLTTQLDNEPLKTRLKTKSWCLAFQYNENKQKLFKIVRPNEIYLDDDHQTAIDINPLCAPDEPELIKLYEKFGSKWLSEHAKRSLIHQEPICLTERSKKLFDLIHHRLDMLFVNNRGERLENLDEKHFQLLKTNLSVYECESIQCQVTFQNRTITLNSNECSSCAVEFDKKQVILYLNKNLLTLDYIDISTELTRFVYRKPMENLVHSISDKLSSPLQTLKRRGIPVDRLLKIPQQQQSIDFHYENSIQQPAIASSQQEQIRENKQRSERGFFQNLKDLLVPIEFNENQNQRENLQSQTETNRITNFGLAKSNDENDMNRMISSSRPYSQQEYHQKETNRYETNNSCEFVPQCTMIRYQHLLNGIPFYFEKHLQLTQFILQQGKLLSFLLSSLSTQVFHLSIETIHLFRDIDSARIAFNSNGSLFYNVRYFEQVYWDELRRETESGRSLKSSDNAIVRRIVNFYYMVTCHELSHNIDSNHDLNFLNRLERVSVRFMDQKDLFVDKFSF